MKKVYIAAVAAALLLPAPAAASPVPRPGDLFAQLPTDVTVVPGDARAVELFGVPVLSLTLSLAQGEQRVVTSRIGLALSSAEGAEVDDSIRCVDLSTGIKVSGAHSQGTNHPGSGAGEVALQGSYLLTAPHAGQYRCELLTETSDGPRTDYVMTVLAGDTYLAAGSIAEVGAAWWQNGSCNSEGDDPGCVYLGAPGRPKIRDVFADDGAATWAAPADAVSLEVIADVQLTSCPSGTHSCVDGTRGGDNFSTVFAGLEFDQLDGAGAVCRIFGTPQTQYSITNAVHHLPIHLALGNVPVSAACGGSRTFRVSVPVRWAAGNPVKIEGSNGFRSAVHALALVRSTDATATVPRVVGSTEAAAGDAIRAAGFAVGSVSRVLDPAAPGTVIAQNAAGGSVEPVGSAVDLTVSLGRAVVPELLGLTEAQADTALSGAGLVAVPDRQRECIEPGKVLSQGLAAGTVVAPGTGVPFLVDTGTRKTCIIS
jgi:hypothetical protein